MLSKLIGYEFKSTRRIFLPAFGVLLLLSLANSDFNNKMFDFIHASDVRIKSDSAMNWSLDGEEAESENETYIKNLHNAIVLYK